MINLKEKNNVIYVSVERVGANAYVFVDSSASFFFPLKFICTARQRKHFKQFYVFEVVLIDTHISS